MCRVCSSIRISRPIVLSVVLLAFVCGCERKEDANPPSEESGISAADPRKPQDRPLSEFQMRLLDLAFEAAGCIPVPPFLKDRSLAQEGVVKTCLYLDQPVRAAQYADQIGDWRRGLCYADTAFYLAQKGYNPQQIQPALKLAGQIARMDHGQRWRSDRIRVRIAQAYLLLEKTEEAEQIRREVETSESGPLLETGVMINREDSFDKQAQILDAQLALMDFEITQNALLAYTRLFDQHYDQPENRDSAEEKIRVSWEKLPFPIRLELLARLAQSALDHSDPDKALSLVNEMQGLLEDVPHSLETYIPAVCELIGLRYKAGDPERARAEAERLRHLYEQKGEEIIDIYRAETIVPLAQTYQAMGQPKAALALYKRAVESAIINPNPRPRAEDLSMICASMALATAEPDAELWATMQEIIKELSPS